MNKKQVGKGSILGALIGDAAGATLEFSSRTPDRSQVKLAMTMLGGGWWRTATGQITDDGEMADREGEYIDHYASVFLQADFCVYIKDSIFGALALQAFAEMIRKAFGRNYRSQEIDFDMSQQTAVFTNKALVDVVVDPRHAFCA